MSKMLPTILSKIVFTAAKKLGTHLAKLPLQRRFRGRQLYKSFSDGENASSGFSREWQNPIDFSAENCDTFLQVMSYQMTFKLKNEFMILSLLT
jgi:hypothetical protein